MTMNEKEWLERAIAFDLGICPFRNQSVKIEARDEDAFTRLWVIKIGGLLLGKDGQFHREPMFQFRDAHFVKTTRFESPDEVHEFWCNLYAKKELP